VTLYEFLREQRITAVKSACAQGGCGACSVVVTSFNYATGSFEHNSINSCITALPLVAECHVSTTNGLGGTKEGFHAIQQRIAVNHGTQCGYCTPGMVMLMYGLLQSTNGEPTLNDVEHLFDGNICRCTGYRPLIQACQSFAVDHKSIPDLEDLGKKFQFQPYNHGEETKKRNLCAHVHHDNVHSLHFTANGYHWYRPTTIDEAVKIYKEHKDSVRFVVGNTSTGIYGKDTDSKVWIDLRYITDFQKIHENGKDIVAGAAVTLSRLLKALTKHTALVDHIRRVSNTNIRNAGSWTGNLVMARTKGFPSDIATILAGVGAVINVIDIASGKQHQLDVLSFLNSHEDHLVISISIPILDEKHDRFQTYRSSIRHNNAYALVNAAFAVTVCQDGKIQKARLVFGVVGKYAKRAVETEKVLIGKVPNHALFLEAIKAIKTEINPEPLEGYITVTDPTGKGVYRHTLPERFLYKFFLYLNLNHLDSGLKSAVLLPPLPYFSSKQTFVERTGREAIPKLEGFIQASGEAIYSAEIPLDSTALHGAVVLSTKAGVTIEKIDISAAQQYPGVVRIITAKDIDDIKGGNDCGFFPGQEELLATKNSPFVGQPIALILAETENQARAATKLVQVTYGDFYDGEPIFDVETAVKKEKFLTHCEHALKSGDTENAFKHCDHVVEGKAVFGGQHPFYMERISAVALKGDNGNVHVYAGAQNATYVQQKIAQALGVSHSQVTVTVKRTGGGFGGKLTRNAPVCQLAALGMKVTDRPVRLELSIEDDLTLTAGRHSGYTLYKVGFSKEGKIIAVDASTFLNGGFSTDFSIGIGLEFNENLDDFYRIPNWNIKTKVAKTNLSTRTATRSFGHIQSKFAIEHIIQHVAATVAKPQHIIAELNMYTPFDCITPALQHLENWTMPTIWASLKEKIEFEKRFAAIEAWNRENKWRKRGIYLTGVKYGIHQGYAAGATAHLTIYDDGTVFVAHGGCEFGTGINTKVAQAVAITLGIPVDHIRIGDTTTDYIPKTGWNGGSVGSEANVEAARRCAVQLKDKLQPFKLKLWSEHPEKKEPTWKEIIKLAVDNHIVQTYSDNYVPLGSQTSEKKGPKWQTHFCEYFSCGIGCTEAEVDILTGEVRLIRSDLIMDVGDTLNPLIDIGQTEGAFVFGLGYLLQEEELNSPQGKVLSSSTWTYKPWLGIDIPKDFRVSLADVTSFPKGVMGTKAIGEPPMILAYSAFGAVNQAINASRIERGLSPFVSAEGPFTIDRRTLASGLTEKDLIF
jgi:xanthine dehydrogenase molybdopterin-binding subunit B/xanthine dehydrogenase iron-sulfur cluster and FAD-binding subunit A